MSYNIDNTQPIRNPSTRQTDDLSDDEKRLKRRRTADRDFKRVLEKKGDDNESEETQSVKPDAARSINSDEESGSESQEDNSKKPKMTLFDLTSSKKVSKDASSAALAGQVAASNTPVQTPRKSVIEQASSQVPVKSSKDTSESPSTVYGKLKPSSKKESGVAGLRTDDTLAAEKELRLKSSRDDAHAGGGYNSRFATEQSDLSYVNPLGANSGAVSAVDAKNAEAKSDAVNMQQIIDQMVDEVYVMQADGKTEMTITLKHPPLFEGASVVVTSFDSAKGEFNVAFHNLTQAAKRVLDMQVNQETLRHGLEVKGYAMHILTVTTQEIKLPNVDLPQTARDGQKGSDGRFAGGGGSGDRGRGGGGSKRQS